MKNLQSFYWILDAVDVRWPINAGETFDSANSKLNAEEVGSRETESTQISQKHFKMTSFYLVFLSNRP